MVDHLSHRLFGRGAGLQRRFPDRTLPVGGRAVGNDFPDVQHVLGTSEFYRIVVEDFDEFLHEFRKRDEQGLAVVDHFAVRTVSLRPPPVFLDQGRRILPPALVPAA